MKISVLQTTALNVDEAFSTNINLSMRSYLIFTGRRIVINSFVESEGIGWILGGPFILRVRQRVSVCWKSLL
jgi:hypothetical protein